MKVLPVGFVALALLTSACGSKPKPAEDPTTTASTATPTAEDMPAAPATTGPSTTATPAADTAATPAPAAPAPTTLKIVALKLSVPAKDSKKLGYKALEVKDDGSILADGKPRMKIVGGALRSSEDAPLFAIAEDGKVTDASGNDVGKFESNDDLTLKDGGKLVVSDDGFVQLIDGKGKTNVLGPKFESAPAWAKREAALIGLTFNSPAPAAAATTAKPAAKPAKKK
jgi:hypothetical protein